MKLTDRQILAAKAARDLFDLLPPQDVQNPKKVMAAVVETLSNYHQAVITTAPLAIAKRVNKLTLKAVADICDELQDVVSRKFERDRAAASHHHGLLPPPKPDQVRKDEQVVDYETRIKPLLVAGVKLIAPAPIPSIDDGRHWKRIAADLAARKARNDHARESTDPPKESSAA